MEYMLGLTIATCSMDHGELCEKQDLSTEQRKLYQDRNYAIIHYHSVTFLFNTFTTFFIPLGVLPNMWC